MSDQPSHLIQDLESRRQQAREAGGKDRIARQHDRGKLTARERLEILLDEGSFEEMDAELSSADPLEFCAAKPYGESLESARERSGESEAVVTGRASVGGHPVVVGAMDFRFIGGSMGSVVGEKVARAAGRSTVRRACPRPGRAVATYPLPQLAPSAGIGW